MESRLRALAAVVAKHVHGGVLDQAGLQEGGLHGLVLRQGPLRQLARAQVYGARRWRSWILLRRGGVGKELTECTTKGPMGDRTVSPGWIGKKFDGIGWKIYKDT